MLSDSIFFTFPFYSEYSQVHNVASASAGLLLFWLLFVSEAKESTPPSLLETPGTKAEGEGGYMTQDEGANKGKIVANYFNIRRRRKNRSPFMGEGLFACSDFTWSSNRRVCPSVLRSAPSFPILSHPHRQPVVARSHPSVLLSSSRRDRHSSSQV